MNATRLFVALKARLDADTGTGGLFATGANLISGVYNTLAPTTLTDTNSYIVFNVASAEQMDGFNIDVIEYTFYLSIFTPVDSGLSAAQAIIDRIYGNALSQAGRVPTYGLHRHSLTLTSTSWRGGIMHRIDQQTNHTETVYQHIETYRIITSLA